MGRSRNGHGQGTNDPQLDVGGLPRARAGRVRRGLDDQARAARSAGADLDHALLAAARSAADEIDTTHGYVMALHHAGRSPAPGILMAQAGHLKAFDQLHARLFVARGEDRDPLADLAAALSAATVDDTGDEG